ncbi:MAG: type transport system permease protein [Solirubrobacteraceae bacterium]|nr:type transport system permease protein [Solirubrobacteraceae bacterium]
MRRLIAGELIKVRTTRTALGFGVSAVLLVLAGVLISILAGDPTSTDEKRIALSFGSGVSTVLLLFGAVGATGEFRHRTLAPAVLIAPDRVRLFLGRLAAYALTALLFAAVMLIVAYAVGIPMLSGQAGAELTGADYAEVAIGGVLATVLAAALGVGLGTLVRNQVAAVVGILVWITIVESLVVLISEDVVDHLPGVVMGRVGQGGDDTMSLATATLVLLAWTAAFSAAAALVDRRRDVE